MVTLGDHDRQSKDRFGNIEVRGIRSVRKHEHFDIGTYNNDIAILEMDVPVSFNDKMNPVCLPNYGKIFFVSLAENYGILHIVKKKFGLISITF